MSSYPMSTVAGVKAAYFERWNATPIKNEDHARGRDLPFVFTRPCPVCDAHISWQGYFSDLNDTALTMGKRHWIYHAMTAASSPLLFWANAHPFTRLIPFPEEAHHVHARATAQSAGVNGPRLFCYPYWWLADWAERNVKLLKQAGVQVFRRRTLNLMHETDWQYLRVLHDAAPSSNWEKLATETYAEMARARRKGIEL